MARAMAIATPLGADVLLFHGMHAREEMSRLFEYQVDLLSAEGEIALDDILGKNVTITLSQPNDASRHFNGVVTRFSQGGMYGRYHRYLAVVRPWLWLLTRTTDCRIFQDMKVPDILKQVFEDEGTHDVAFELTNTYRKWTYCVQYRETDFNFVSRLMEEEGIYYYFRHSEGHNTLVLTDSSSKHEPTPGYETIPFIAPDRLTRAEIEHINKWSFTREIQPGVYAHDDYDLERPSVELQTKKVLTRAYSPSKYEVYDYPGEYLTKDQGLRLVGIRMEEEESPRVVVAGSSTCRGLAAGFRFKLRDHYRRDFNQEYVLTSVYHSSEQGDNYRSGAADSAQSFQYSNHFQCLPHPTAFRPPRVTPVPLMQGSQTAVVVGPKGEEIYADKYGRVKVQFHWDRRGQKDQESSCWIRVSHPWAGKNWGAIATPRIGQEVIVDFLEGDPDQPIITGRVYNAEQMPPYALPANKTQTGIKSRSSLGGSPDNFNEIRFEDKKGSEQVYIHAEKNQDIVVENDETHSVGHDRTKTIGHDETTHVKHDRTETVDNNETITVHGARTETVDKDETITVHASRTRSVDKNETITVSLMRNHTVGINEAITVGAAQEVTVGAMQTITVGANQTTSVGVNQSNTIRSNQTTDVASNRTISVGKNLSTTVGGDESRAVSKGRTTQVGKDDALTVAKNLVINAGESVTIATGSAIIQMKKDGTIKLKGKDITIEASGKINVKASSDIVMKGSKILQN